MARFPKIEFSICILIPDPYKPTIKILGTMGELVIYDYQKREIVFETKILIFSPIIFAFQKGPTNHLHLLKKAGNLSLIEWEKKMIIHENILQEDEITCFDFIQKKAIVFTASSRGIIVMS